MNANRHEFMLETLVDFPDDAIGDGKPKTVRRDHRKVGRNDPCPCGSGKKYKKCHMRKDQAAG